MISSNRSIENKCGANIRTGQDRQSLYSYSTTLFPSFCQCVGLTPSFFDPEFFYKDFKITKPQIDEQYEKIVMIVRPSMRGDLKRLEKLDGGTFIYSMWEGYKKEKSTKDFIQYLQSRDISEASIHTSGHADLEALKEMVDAVRPKAIVPIHTFEGDRYDEVLAGTEVIHLEDNQTL